MSYGVPRGSCFPAEAGVVLHFRAPVTTRSPGFEMKGHLPAEQSYTAAEPAAAQETRSVNESGSSKVTCHELHHLPSYHIIVFIQLLPVLSVIVTHPTIVYRFKPVKVRGELTTVTRATYSDGQPLTLTFGQWEEAGENPR